MILMGYLGDGIKVGKGRDQGGLGRNKLGKTKVKGDKRS